MTTASSNEPEHAAESAFQQFAKDAGKPVVPAVAAGGAAPAESWWTRSLKVLLALVSIAAVVWFDSRRFSSALGWAGTLVIGAFEGAGVVALSNWDVRAVQGYVDRSVGLYRYRLRK
ncbi:MAG TPA: hypothetical protein VF292_03815 [Rhodanobacteraceae bacterium]